MSFQQTIQLITSVFPNAEILQDVTENSVTESCLSKNYQRSVTEYKNLSQRFKVPCRVYTQQYSELYFYRLQCLKPHLIETCQQKWPMYPVLRDIQSIPSVGELCIVYGIVYKSMKLKPSVLREYIKDLQLECPANSYLSDTDQLYLEDETVRIVITQAEKYDKPLCVEKFVTGLVIACLGTRTLMGQFEVQDWAFPGIISPPKIMLSSKKPKYVAFLSDLSVGSSLTHYDSLLRVRSFLVGALSTSSDISCITGSIVRVIIAGLTHHQDKSDESLYDDTISQNKVNSFTHQLTTLQEADAFLYDLACSVNTDLVPGVNDPTNYSLPQNPLHPAFFPKCRQLKTFQCVTNPYNFRIENKIFLGCAQQGLEDIRNFSSINSNLDALKLCFTAQHLCPTAPDTLPCYPFTQSDPFCFPQSSTEAPNVLFSACHDSLEWEYYNNDSKEWNKTNMLNSSVLAVCLPSFMKTRQLVLVDIVTFHIKKIQF